MDNFSWVGDDEDRWKAEIESLFERKFREGISKYNPLEFGNLLFQTFKDTEIEAVKLVVPRSIRKWASKEREGKWQEIIKDDAMLLDVRKVGVSIANTLRPLAGNKFALYVAQLLNLAFTENNLPLVCESRGKEKRQLADQLMLKDKGETKEFKPDIDIVVFKTMKNHKRPVAIISAKTTLAERIMQTINWKRYINQHPEKSKEIKLYLVTLWETFNAGEVNRERVQELDGVFVCNKKVSEYGKIKHFSKIINELKQL